jgi:hypothetical protein
MRVENHFHSLFFFSSLWASIGLCQNLGTLFNGKNTIDKGGCGNHAGTLQNWLTDTQTLVATMLTAMPVDPTQIGNDQTLKNNLGAYFGIRFTQQGAGPINKQDVNAYSGVRGTSMSKESQCTFPPQGS